MKKFVILFLTIITVLCIPALAYADENSDGAATLLVDIQTDQSSYHTGDIVTVDISVSNPTDYVYKNLDCEILLPEGLTPEDESKITKSITRLDETAWTHSITAEVTLPEATLLSNPLFPAAITAVIVAAIIAAVILSRKKKKSGAKAAAMILILACAVSAWKSTSVPAATANTDQFPLTVSKTVELNEQEYEIKVMLNVNETTETTNKVTGSELFIPNGENTIYGKLYTPQADGEYPAIILCHGYNGTNKDFTSECNLYAQNGYVAYAFDFCGGSTGSKSTGSSTDMTIFTEKSDLIAVFNYLSEMDVVDASQIVLFGGSQGGLVASLAAEELSDKVAGLALYFPAYCIPDNWRDNYPDPDAAPETFDFWGLTLGKQFVVSIHDLQVFDEIGGFDKDVLILHGDQDAIVPLSYSQQAVELYANAELIVMSGEGHGFTPDATKTARETVLSFLDSITE